MHVVSINTSPGGIPKLPHDTCMVTTAGLLGDGHNHEKHRSPNQAVSMLDLEILEAIKDEGHDLVPGALGENLTLSGAAIQMCALGDRLVFPSGLELEISKVRNPCYVLDQISTELKRTMWNRLGIYARVTKEGLVQQGDEFEVIRDGAGPRPAVREVPEGCVDGTTFAQALFAESIS